jgi:hypothetical protein
MENILYNLNNNKQIHYRRFFIAIDNTSVHINSSLSPIDYEFYGNDEINYKFHISGFSTNSNESLGFFTVTWIKELLHMDQSICRFLNIENNYFKTKRSVYYTIQTKFDLFQLIYLLLENQGLRMKILEKNEITNFYEQKLIGLPNSAYWENEGNIKEQQQRDERVLQREHQEELERLRVYYVNLFESGKDIKTTKTQLYTNTKLLEEKYKQEKRNMEARQRAELILKRSSRKKGY